MLSAWNTYLKDYNHGRGVVFIGHSQGSGVLEQLISQQVDNNAAERHLLVSAIILGGNVMVKDGRDVGGTFQHIPACHSSAQLGCVVAFSTYDQPAPSNSLFGRSHKAARYRRSSAPTQRHWPEARRRSTRSFRPCRLRRAPPSAKRPGRSASRSHPR